MHRFIQLQSIGRGVKWDQKGMVFSEYQEGNIAVMKGNMAVMKGNMAFMKGNMAPKKGGMA